MIRWFLAIVVGIVALTYFLDTSDNSTTSTKKRSARSNAQTKLPVVGAKEDQKPEPNVVDRYPNFPDSFVLPSVAKALPLNSTRQGPWVATRWEPKVVAVKASKIPTQVTLAPSQQVSAPTVVALPFEFIGVMDDPKGGQMIFLKQGEEQLAARVGETISNQWRVDALLADRVVFMYLPANLPSYLARGIVAY